MRIEKESKKEFIKLLVLFMAIITPWILGIAYFSKPADSVAEHSIKLVNYKADVGSRVDHQKFLILQQDFKTPQDVTAACVSCHNMAGQDIMRSSHWTWAREYVTESGDTLQLGKKNMINNFCIGVSSNEARCTSCHIGYGWEDENFDFTDSRNIDCIVCHDQTGTYKKFPTAAGYPVNEAKKFGNTLFQAPDYAFIAQNVGSPSRQNCGVCHFVGGGGNNVKHGDIAMESNQASKEIDVHMAIEGANMDCVACHIADEHNITGNLYSVSSDNTNSITCDQCHTNYPHKNQTLNDHSNKVACQTCHIPKYAKASATKMNWDWSSAGQFNEDGSTLIKKDSAGNITYHSMKGTFVWENMITPEYYWFNGKADHYLLGDKVDTIDAIQVNSLLGSYEDEFAKIFPVKVHRGRQIYDPVNQILILPHLFGKDSSAYWTGYDWNKAAKAGMKSAKLPYSGQYTFARTEMYWPINHMVAPAEESLGCSDCHSRDGHLANLAGFYLPGRDRSIFLDRVGFILIVMAIAGVAFHATLRIAGKRNN
jgi:octaheme c-type cytochrome (tetrathionate reductase family)